MSMASSSSSLPEPGQLLDTPPAAWWEWIYYNHHRRCLKHVRELQDVHERENVAFEAMVKVKLSEGDLESMNLVCTSMPQTEKESRIKIMAAFFDRLHFMPQDIGSLFDWDSLKACTSPTQGWKKCLEAVVKVCGVKHISDIKLPGFSEVGYIRKDDLELLYDLGWHGKGSWKEKTAMRLQADDKDFWVSILEKLFPCMAKFILNMGYGPDDIPPAVPADYFWTIGEDLTENVRQRLLAFFYASRSSTEIRPLMHDLSKHITVVDGHLVVVRDLPCSGSCCWVILLACRSSPRHARY